MSKTYDAIFKQIIDLYAPDWAAWLAAHFGLPAGPLTPLDPDLSTVQAWPDKVFRLPGSAGLLHLEVQSSRDGELADRILFYNVLLNHRHDGPVHSMAILLRPEANATNLTGTVTRHRADGREYHRFGFDLVKVWEQRADDFLAGGLGTAPLGLLTDDAKGRLPELVKRLTDRIKDEVESTGKRESLLTGSYLLTGLRYDKDETFPLFQGIDYMKESSTYQAILSEGRAEGVATGRIEGRIETLRAMLLGILERKFGSVPAALESRVRTCTDLEKLQEGTYLAATATAIDAFERDVQL